ncbi:MAG: biotin transporter BioY [Candidatus Omnitrophota bacterium]
MRFFQLTLAREKVVLLDIVKVFSAAILLCLSAFIRIPLFFSPVPVTMQTFVVFLIGGIMSPALACASIALYISAGIFGAPFFANAGWGIPYVLGPTGGYLLGFFSAAAAMAALRSFVPRFFSMLVGIVIIYLCGGLWLKAGYGMSWQQVFYLGMLPFFVPDIIKARVASWICDKVSGR